MGRHWSTQQIPTRPLGESASSRWRQRSRVNADQWSRGKNSTQCATVLPSCTTILIYTMIIHVPLKTDIAQFYFLGIVINYGTLYWPEWQTNVMDINGNIRNEKHKYKVKACSEATNSNLLSSYNPEGVQLQKHLVLLR